MCFRLSTCSLGQSRASTSCYISDQLPLTECLKDTVARVIPYFEEEIKPKMLAGEKVIIVAHGNSLRGLVKYLENISDKDIVEVNIPNGVPLVYEFDKDFNVISKRYLGEQDVQA